MIITLSGITGVGKSYLKKFIQQKLNLKNPVIVTTRKPRKGENNGIDKFFVSEKEFDRMKKKNEIVADFEFLHHRYAYFAQDMNAEDITLIEVHYSAIEKFKKEAKNVFAIYMIPKTIQMAKVELKNRQLDQKIEDIRLAEMKEQITLFQTSKTIQSNFDYVFYNDYTEQSKLELLQIVKGKMIEQKKELVTIV